jgi:ABC-type nitrate/sulfonate/bicarbonate transport system substrate-binding protein
MQAEDGLGAYLIGQPGITSVEDLRGKLLAADPVDSNLDLIRMKIMREHGMGDDDYDYEIIGSTPARAKAFLEGKVAAAMLTPPSSDRVLDQGGVLLANAEDYVPNWPLACGWGLRSWVEANRDLVVRFIRAWAASTDWLLKAENHEETIRMLIDQEGLNEERAEHAYARVVPKGRINPEAIRKNLELRIELGLYPPPHHTAEHFYDTSYWCEATGEPAPETGGIPANAA